MRIRVFLNDAAGGSFSPESKHYAKSQERREASQAAERPYMPMMDGYDAERAVLVESVLSPMAVPNNGDPHKACEHAFMLLNADNRANRKLERSLSVGDVVEIGKQRYACVDVGWEQI